MAQQEKKVYFTAGPAKIPDEIMQQVHAEFLNYKGLGISVIELSHRSATFTKIITEAEENLRKLMNIPSNYSVLFMHGGAKTQFDSVAMNLCPELLQSTADYITNGYWSKAAAKCAKKYVKVHEQATREATRMPLVNELEKVSNSAYRFYCDNETIQGIEFNYVPESGDNNVPLVCDMTSNFLSRTVDISKFGVIFASAQKNCGTSGLAIVIVRNDLLDRAMPITPTVQSYKGTADSKSVGNTPLVFQIYIANLCFEWILKQGGLQKMDEVSKQKSNLLYETIDNSNEFYTCPVEKESRSRMNVVFLLKDEQLMTKFIDEAKEANLYELKGHRSVGGMRASLYHGITFDDVKRLVEFMKKFQTKYS